MFYIIGLGLGSLKDITVRGLEVTKKCDRVYLESYTSIFPSGVGLEDLEAFYERKLIAADRELVEQGADSILEGAENADIALLVVGDPLSATTHTDIALRARQKGIKVDIIHNASILNAVGCCGLQLYRFGEVVSIPYWEENWKPQSFFDKVLSNYRNNLHTLCLLDIKVKEVDWKNISSKKVQYMPPRFMSASEAANQILQTIETSTQADITRESLCVGLARVGCETQKILACSLAKMEESDLGEPLHSLVIPAAELHPLEKEYIEQFKQ